MLGMVGKMALLNQGSSDQLQSSDDNNDEGMKQKIW